MKFTFAASDDRHIAWTGAAIKDDGFLYPRNDKVCSFTSDSVLDAPEPVEYNSPVPCINCGDRKCVNCSHLVTAWSFLKETNILLIVSLFYFYSLIYIYKNLLWWRLGKHNLGVCPLTIIQCRVYNATTNGKCQTQLSNGLKKLGHDDNLIA